MRYEKQQVLKQDGRYLVFYHFPDTATADQTEAFLAAESAMAEANAAAAASQSAPSPTDAVDPHATVAPPDPHKDKPSV